MTFARRSLVAALLCLAAIGAWAQDKVAYHVNDAKAQALGTLRNIRNHLDTDPTAQILVVTHANGVDFLMEGAKEVKCSEFGDALIRNL